MTVILGARTVHRGWTTVRMLRMRLPDGAEVEHTVEDHGPAAAVLPYDPDRRTALLVRLPRAPLVEAGAEAVLEVPAGGLDSEAPEACARREALEEAGVRLKDLELVAQVWSMPSVSTERLALYLGRYDAAARIGPGGGKAGENENITVVEADLRDLARPGGELLDLKTLVLVQALQLRRPDLFDD